MLQLEASTVSNITQIYKQKNTNTFKRRRDD